MIKIEHVITPSPEQMEFVIEGARNPLNSWDKSDSEMLFGDPYCPHEDFALGPNDEKLFRRLCAAGPDERKFMRQMPIMMRITAPMYWWSEYDTYKVATVANSTSKMHKLLAKEFELSDFSFDKIHCLDAALNGLIDILNGLRKSYFEVKSEETKKTIWYSILQLLPNSYNQTRNVTFNYETARNIYWARKDHKLDEWALRNPDGMCATLSKLPHSFLITEKNPMDIYKEESK